jgi:hypothetical protein
VNGNHIEFWTLESEDQADQRHLRACPACQRQLELYRFVQQQVRNVPTIAAPPFFATRVQAALGEARSSVIFYFERIAAHLAPLLTALILATSFLVYSVTRNERIQVQATQTPLLEASFPDMTVESVLGLTAEPNEGSEK